MAWEADAMVQQDTVGSWIGGWWGGVRDKEMLRIIKNSMESVVWMEQLLPGNQEISWRPCCFR